MLSNKMTVSLMSLITIIALGLIAMPALAAKVSIAVKDLDAMAGDQKDISFKDGIQMVGDGTNTITLEVTTDEVFGAVVTTGDDTTNNAFELVHSTGAAPTIGTDDITRSGDGKKYTIVMNDVPTIADGADAVKVSIYLQPNSLMSLTTGTKRHDGTSITIEIIPADPDPGIPDVLSHMRSDGSTHPVFEETFTVILRVSEEPKKDTFTKDLISIKDGLATVVSVNFVGTMDESTDTADVTAGTHVAAGTSTGGDNKVYNYAVTLKPKYEKADAIKLTVAHFLDQFGKSSTNPAVGSDPPYKEVEVAKVAASAVTGKAGTAGTSVSIPNDLIIPAGGSLIVARDDGDGANSMEKTDSTYIQWPGDPKEVEADIALRKPNLRTYNMIEAGLPDLENFLTLGGTIDLIGVAGLQISEIMWATDAGSMNRQWIEIMNTTAAAVKTKDIKLMFYASNEVLPDMTDATKKIVDRVGTVNSYGFWSIAGKGQSGRTEGLIERRIVDGEDVDIAIAVVPTDRLISMQRKMDAAGMYADGTMEGSWASSMPPSPNFKEAAKGLFVGTPGTSPRSFAIAPTPETPPATVDVAMASDIMITEIMVDTDNGRLPQWIELTSSATGEVSLDGWELRIDNAIDADVLGGGNIITVDLSGVVLDVSAHTGNLGKGQSALVVAWAARDVSSNIRADRVVNVATQLNQTRQYQLLSYKGFKITLAPPQMGGVFAPGDIAGNLHEGWELPMSEAGRSSLIRREMNATGATMGTDANGWTLADSTLLITGQVSYYGNDEDAGTPGQDAGGPLPVSLSHFRPARDKETGAVVITWSTQSELNNAGFFIKRAQQRDGQFKVINATMVPGAGTTSEKQFYTFTDTTAQPNVVYYYQIEDVSLDGNRQTLTNGIRLKGHIGAAGKLTTSWGELKSIQ